MNRMYGAASLLLCATAVLPAGAQMSAGPDNTPVLHAETRVVQVEVVATDSHGQPVVGLRKDDFAIRDNGHARTIDIFSVESEAHAVSLPPQPKLPAGVFTNRGPAAPVQDSRAPTVMLLDASKGTSVPYLWARQAVLGVLKKLPSDERIAVYVVAYKQGLVLLQDYTTDHALILRRLNHYSAPSPPPSAPARNMRPLTAEESAYLLQESTENIRLSFQGLADHLSLGPGRKNIFSDAWVYARCDERFREVCVGQDLYRVE